MKHATRSVFTLTLLFGLVFLIASLYLSYHHQPVWIAGGIGIAFILLSYLVGPWWIEFILNINWDSSRTALPARNLEFLQQLAAEQGVKMPRVAVIKCAMPNAFTFGHVPGDARIVVTDALLETLTPEEVNAVIAHEMGHIVHWDFVVMTLASLVPLLLWELYAFLTDEVPLVSLAAYASYWASRYGVLSLSRSREYYADQFAAQVTHSPALLSSALLKIGYGMAQYASVRKADVKAKKNVRLARLDGVFGMLGVSNAQPSLALCGVTPDEAARVIRWDLVNPFARIYEFSSTHPLIGRRIQALNKEAIAQGQAPAIPLPQHLPLEWSNFFVACAIWAAPWVCGFLLFAGRFLFHHSDARAIIGLTLTGLLFITWVLRIVYRYPAGFAPSQVRALTEDTKVSDMSAIPVRLEGEIIGSTGRFSSDLMFQDSTGMMFILDRQSLPGASVLMADKAAQYAGAKVVIEGWNRRSLRPYVELSKLVTEDGRSHRSYSCYIQVGIAFFASVGIFWITRW